MPGTLSFLTALDIAAEKELIAFIGAGGKTSWMMTLAGELRGRVVVSTTTRMFVSQVEEAAASLPAEVCVFPDLSPLQINDDPQAKFIVTGCQVEDKVGGVPGDAPGQIMDQSGIDYFLVEADGAKMKPIKAPACHEPVIPEDTTLVVPVVGMDALGRPLREVAFRPELLAGFLDKQLDDLLDAGDIAILLNHTDGGLKDVPEFARVIPILNKITSEEQKIAAREIAKRVLQNQRIQQVISGNSFAVEKVIEVQRRITAVVLAAGQSLRMGRTKTTMPWGDTTVLGQTISNLQQSGVHDLLVVSGHEAGRVEAIAAAAGVSAIFNPDYALGEMLSSLQTAVTHLPDECSAVLVMLADQPMIKPETIDQLLIAYWQGAGSIIAPEFGGRRANPVLIDRQHFQALLALSTGSAPRDLLKRHTVHLVPVHSDAVLQDLDSMADYERYRPE